MMLDHLDGVAAAESIRSAVDAVLGGGVVVLDTSGQPNRGMMAAAQAVAEAIRTG